MQQRWASGRRALAPLQGDEVRLSLKQRRELVDSVQVVLELAKACLGPLVSLRVAYVEEHKL